MESSIFHIYGPISINSYGLFVALGFIIFIYLTQKDITQYTTMSEKIFFSSINVAMVSAFFGARILYILNNRDSIQDVRELFEVWNGGLSILGGIAAPFIIVPCYLLKKNISILPFLDIVAQYLPIWQSIARFGCYMAGCCYGSAMPEYFTQKLYSITGIYFVNHPTQLYSMLLLAIISIILYLIKKYTFCKHGFVTALYIMLMSAERFWVEFLRGDVIVLHDNYPLSLNQSVAIILFSLAALFLILRLYYPEKA